MIFSKATLYKIGYPVLQAYWFLRRPTTEGVRCVVTLENKILLIKHTYGSPLLTTVGGGIKMGESLEQAVIREVKEEVGLSLKNIKQLGSIKYNGEFKKDTIHVFFANANEGEITIDLNEIKEAGWFDKDNLPSNISPLFKQFYNLAFPDTQEKF